MTEKQIDFLRAAIGATIDMALMVNDARIGERLEKFSEIESEAWRRFARSMNGDA